MTRVRGYKRRPYRVMGRIVHPGSTTTYSRRQRPKSKKRIVGQKPYSLYEIRDGNGEFRGWKRKR